MSLKLSSSGFSIKSILNFGGFIFIVGIIINVFYKIPGIAISIIGFIILAIGAIRLKKEKGNLRNGLSEELVGGASNKMDTGRKIIIVGIVCSLVWLGVNLGLSWYQKKEITEQCRKQCCEYNSVYGLWLYKCDASLCCITISENDDLQDCCMRFESEKSCINYCFTDLKKMFFPDTFTSLKAYFVGN
jgi:hypothetical protein